MNNLNNDKFKNVLNTFDTVIDNKLNRKMYDDESTNFAKNLVVLRGKEIREIMSKYENKDKFNKTIELLENECPNLDKNKLKFILFREGIWHNDYLKIIPLFILMSTLLMLFKCIIGLDIQIVNKVILCFLSLFISFFIAAICDPSDSKLSLYFGLGHKK
jgi:hypothetical protein